MAQIKIDKKDAVWSYLGVIFRFGTNLIVLPLVLKFLSDEDLGLWYVFGSIGALVDLLNFGFAPSIARNISYVLCGATELKKESLEVVESKEVDVKTLYIVLKTCQYIYIVISIVSLILLLTFGSWYVTSLSGKGPLLAWFLFSLGIFLNMLYNYYSSFLRGVGAIAQSSIADIYSRGIQIILTTVLLLTGFGLVGVAFSSLVSGVVYRLYSKRAFLKYEGIGKLLDEVQVANLREERKRMFPILWYNSSKEGVITLSRFLSTQANTLICSNVIGLSGTGSYGLSVQIATIFATVAQIPFTILHPKMQEASVTANRSNSIKYFSSSISLYIIAFILFALLFFIGKPVLLWLKPTFSLDNSMMVGVFIYFFIYHLYSLFASYISTYNELPYTLSFIVTSIVSVIGSFVLAKYFSLGIWALIIAPLIVSCVYNAWKWPKYVFNKYLRVSLCDFIKAAVIFKNK